MDFVLLVIVLRHVEEIDPLGMIRRATVLLFAQVPVISDLCQIDASILLFRTLAWVPSLRERPKDKPFFMWFAAFDAHRDWEIPAASVRDFVFAERNWHTQRYHERMERYGDWVYIRNNLPELRGLNFVHLSRSQGEASAAQEDIFMKPRPEDTLFNVAEDPYQLENRSGDPGHADKLALLRRALDQWTRKTGDTLPKLDDMTLDRANRDTWEAKSQSGRPGVGEVPGQATQAWEINHPGPVHTGDLKDAKASGGQGAR